MKQLDWKSFAIGILLTTTVVFGVAATNPTTGKQWDENQSWVLIKEKQSKVEENAKYHKLISGFEPFAVQEDTVWYRMPMDSYTGLKEWADKKIKRLGYTAEDL